MLHDMVEAVEGEASAETTERVSCDEVEKSSLRGDRGSSPCIATSSNDPSSCTHAWGGIGESGGGVQIVGRAGPTLYGVAVRLHIMGV